MITKLDHRIEHLMNINYFYEGMVFVGANNEYTCFQLNCKDEINWGIIFSMSNKDMYYLLDDFEACEWLFKNNNWHCGGFYEFDNGKYIEITNLYNSIVG